MLCSEHTNEPQVIQDLPTRGIKQREIVVAMRCLSKTKFFRGLKFQISKAFWKSMKMQNKQDCSIPTLLSNGSAVSDNHDKASLLNSFFYKCFNANSPPLPNIPTNLQPSYYPLELLCDKAEVFDLILGLDPWSYQIHWSWWNFCKDVERNNWCNSS